METKEIVLPKHRFLINSDICPDFAPQMIDPYYWINQKKIFSSSRGRGTAYFIDAGENRKWVLRHYLRGGFIAKFMKDGYFYPGRNRCRPYLEFMLLADLHEKGLPVPEPVVAHVNLNFYPVAHYDIIMKYIENSRDLVSVLKERALTEGELEGIGEVLAKLKEHNVYHHDLNIHNIMLDDSGKFWVIDFDKGEIAPGHFSEMCDRLHRSFTKEKSIHGNEFNWDDSSFEKILKSCGK